MADCVKSSESSTKILELEIRVVFCEYLGERVRRSRPDSEQTFFDLPEFRL